MLSGPRRTCAYSGQNGCIAVGGRPLIDATANLHFEPEGKYNGGRDLHSTGNRSN
jgi:hypothetical protein